MTPTDKPSFVTTVTALFETFGREVSDAQLLGYWRGLSDLPIDRVQHAVDRAFREHEKFVPTPAELRKLAGERSPEDAAVDAWADLLGNVSVGCYATVSFRDRVVNATIRAMGGWVTVCDRFAEGQSQEKWIRQEFIRAYVAIAKRSLGEEEIRPLGGLSEVAYDRSTGKLTKPKPVMIGRERVLPTSITSDRPHRQALSDIGVDTVELAKKLRPPE